MSPSDNGSSDTPPQSPLFRDAPGASAPTIGVDPFSAEDHVKIDHLKQLIKDGKIGGGRGNDGRPPAMLPFLMIRSFTGDNGARPFGQVFWESPDIWTAPGDPSVTPEIPPTHGGIVRAGESSTVYAHVWNLGLAPLTGVVVSFYWCNPSLAIDGAHVNLIGMARVDLGPRSSPLCHQLVKCPKPWIPVVENGGHECLIAKVSGFGDDVPATEWDPWHDRHVGQRNISVVQSIGQINKIVRRFQLGRMTAATRFELTQAGAEAKTAVQIVAPHLTLDTRIETHTLAHLDAKNVLTVRAPEPAIRRILPHTLADRTAPATPVTTARTLSANNLSLANATIETLAGHTALFDDALLAKLDVAARPGAGEAQVLRIMQYDGEQLIGGYTLVVGEPA